MPEGKGGKFRGGGASRGYEEEGIGMSIQPLVRDVIKKGSENIKRLEPLKEIKKIENPFDSARYWDNLA